MSIYKKDLQAEQKAHAETKILVEKLKARISELENAKPEVITKEVVKEVPVEVVKYVKVPDLSQVSKEEIEKAYNTNSLQT